MKSRELGGSFRVYISNILSRTKDADVHINIPRSMFILGWLRRNSPNNVMWDMPILGAIAWRVQILSRKSERASDSCARQHEGKGYNFIVQAHPIGEKLILWLYDPNEAQANEQGSPNLDGMALTRASCQSPASVSLFSFSSLPYLHHPHPMS